MRNLIRALSSLLVLLVLIPCGVAKAQTCYGLPPDSPIASYSPDDVPPAATAKLMNVNGQMFYARPNHQTAFVQTGPNEQKVWFSIDVHFTDTDAGSLFYNRRYRADGSSPWYWQFSQSVPVTDPSVRYGFVDAVLYSATPKYGCPTCGGLYKYVMYTVNQPKNCNGAIGGYGMVSFSNDGTCWTHLTPMWRNGGPSSTCAPELGSNLVPVEALGAIDSGSTIYLMGMEGDNGLLNNIWEMSNNHVAWGTSYPWDAETVMITTDPSMSGSGLFSPHAFPENDMAWPERYRSYLYFFNMAIAWDNVNGDLYVTRGYPYPYDRCAAQGGAQCNPFGNNGLQIKVPTYTQDWGSTVWNPYFYSNQSVSDCGGSLALYPNRYQIYKMHLGDLSNFSQVHTGTWSLLADRGNNLGYESYFTSYPYQSTPLVAGQSSGTRDAGAASFMVDNAGQLVRTNGVGYVFAGSTLREHLSVGPCQTTGNERIVMDPIP